MTSATPEAGDHPAGPVEPDVRKPRIRPATVAIAALTVAIAGLWIYAWFLAPRGNVDRFDDRAWADQAEDVCAATRIEWLALPRAGTFEAVEPKTEALRLRAEVIDQVTALLAAQVADLRSTEPADATSQEGVSLWLGDWDGYLGNRRAQADRLRAGEDPPFTVNEEGGAPVTLRMDAFAKTNSMPSCIVPDDIG